jgi:hypothetical protein
MRAGFYFQIKKNQIENLFLGRRAGHKCLFEMPNKLPKNKIFAAACWLLFLSIEKK